MLTLRRKQGESIQLIVDGKVITVKVSTINCQNSRNVQLSFDAPDEVRIVRTELLESD